MASMASSSPYCFCNRFRNVRLRSASTSTFPRVLLCHQQQNRDKSAENINRRYSPSLSLTLCVSLRTGVSECESFSSWREIVLRSSELAVIGAIFNLRYVQSSHFLHLFPLFTIGVYLSSDETRVVLILSFSRLFFNRTNCWNLFLLLPWFKFNDVRYLCLWLRNLILSEFVVLIYQFIHVSFLSNRSSLCNIGEALFKFYGCTFTFMSISYLWIFQFGNCSLSY